MEYTNEVIINLPRERVIALFDSTENLYKWQPGLVSFEHMEGEPGQVGAKSMLEYDENGREIEMVETILERSLPEKFTAKYETAGVKNISVNYFEPVSASQTRWKTENEFQFSGLMRIISFFMRGAFPKQTQQTMESFKQFAESTSQE